MNTKSTSKNHCKWHHRFRFFLSILFFFAISLIVSKARPTMALTVLLPSCTGNESSEVNISCVGCTVTLQQRRYEETGCANQKWAYDPSLGFLFPFNTNVTDKGEIF